MNKPFEYYLITIGQNLNEDQTKGYNYTVQQVSDNLQHFKTCWESNINVDKALLTFNSYLENKQDIKTPLTLEIIESYKMQTTRYTPDYDDKGYTFLLPSGIEVSGYFVINGKPCVMSMLEGMDGYLIIETKEELDLYYNMDYDSLVDYVDNLDEDFDPEDY